MFAMTEPNIFPKAMSICFVEIAATETAISGRLVRIESKINPIESSSIFVSLESLIEAFIVSRLNSERKKSETKKIMIWNSISIFPLKSVLNSYNLNFIEIDREKFFFSRKRIFLGKLRRLRYEV